MLCRISLVLVGLAATVLCCSVNVGQVGCSTACPTNRWQCRNRKWCHYVPDCHLIGRHGQQEPRCSCETVYEGTKAVLPAGEDQEADAPSTSIKLLLLASGSLLVALSLAVARPSRKTPLAHQDGASSHNPPAPSSGDTTPDTSAAPRSAAVTAVSLFCYVGAMAVFIVALVALCQTSVTHTKSSSLLHTHHTDNYSELGHLKSVMQSVWDNATLQAVVTQPNPPHDLDVFLGLFRTELGSLHASHHMRTDLSSASVAIGAELGLHDTTNTASDVYHAHLTHCPPGSAILIQSIEASSDYTLGVINSALTMCPPHHSHDEVSVWFTGVAGSGSAVLGSKQFTWPRAVVVSELSHSGVSVRSWHSHGFSDEVREGAATVGVLLAVAGVSHSESIPLSPRVGVRSHWLLAPHQHNKDLVSTMAALDTGVSSVVHALNTIASQSPSSTTTLIGQQTCISMKDFEYDISMETLGCLDDKFETEFLDWYVGDIAWVWGGDKSKIHEHFRWWPHTLDPDAWIKHSLHVTGQGSSSIKFQQLMKARDKTRACSHWVLFEYQGLFELAPDLLIWKRTSHGWFGFNSKEETIVERVPHNADMNDLLRLEKFFDILAFANLARVRGIAFEYPKMPGCH